MSTRLALALGVLVLVPVIAAVAQAAGSSPDAGLSPAEQAVVDELSLARTKPQDYVKFLEDYKRHFNRDGTVDVRGRRMTTREGVKAVDEAIEFLKKAKPLSAMTASKPLSLAALDHAQDTGPKGTTGHDGSDGSKPADRIGRYCTTRSTSGENIAYGAYGPGDARAIVIQFLVDDGVPSRGHRTNIFNPAFKVVGVAIGKHNVFGNMCVLDFADAVTDKKLPAAKPGAR